jgi:hypothetical protein
MKSNVRTDSLGKTTFAAPQSLEPTARGPLFSILLSMVAAFSLAACGSTDLDLGENHKSDEEGAGEDAAPERAGPSTDTIIMPPPNGTLITEAEACDAIAEAQEASKLGLECVFTTRACPTLLRAMTGARCVEYDLGSVLGCVELYKGASDCKELAKVFSACVVTFYPDTKSAECE